MEIYTLLHGWFAKQLMNWMQFVKQGNKIPISVCSLFFGGEEAAEYSSSLVVSLCAGHWLTEGPAMTKSTALLLLRSAGHLHAGHLIVRSRSAR